MINKTNAITSERKLYIRSPQSKMIAGWPPQSNSFHLDNKTAYVINIFLIILINHILNQSSPKISVSSLNERIPHKL